MPDFNKPQDRKLIQLVKSHPSLYNKNVIDYRKKTRVNAAWEAIAEVLNRSTEECRHRWREIRDQYKKFLNRKSSSTRISNSKYDNEQLSFLDEFLADKEESNEIVYLIEDGYQTSCVTEKTPTIVSCQTIPCGNSSSSEIKVEHNSGNTNSKRPLRRTIPPKRYNDSIDDISDPESPAEEMPDKKPLKQKSPSKLDLPKTSKKLKTEVEVYNNYTNGESREIVNVIKQERSVPEEENPIHTFFRSMASTVMTFPAHLIAETRMEVCNIVSRMELRALMENGL